MRTSDLTNAIVQGNQHIDRDRSASGPWECSQIDRIRGRRSTVAMERFF